MMFTFHGLPKVQLLLSGEELRFADPIGIGAVPSLILAAIAEFLCSILVAFGIWTRWASLILLITMIVAVFGFHASDPFSQKELPTLFMFGYLMLTLTGGGRFSLGSFLGRGFQ